MLANIRAKNLQIAHHLGYPINRKLPLLDLSTSVRSVEQAGRRFLALHAIISIAYGFQKNKVKNWLVKEGLDGALSNKESALLKNEITEEEKHFLQWQVEALWAFAWYLRCHETLDFSKICADNLINMMPDLKADTPAQPYLDKLAVRETSELLQACDLAYCLHWGAREAELTRRAIPKAVPIQVIEERRRALDWLISDQDWDEVSLDT